MTLVALLTPVLGVANATAVALITRVLHTGGDLVLAAVSWLWAHVLVRLVGSRYAGPRVRGPTRSGYSTSSPDVVRAPRGRLRSHVGGGWHSP